MSLVLLQAEHFLAALLLSSSLLCHCSLLVDGVHHQRLEQARPAAASVAAWPARPRAALATCLLQHVVEEGRSALENEEGRHGKSNSAS